MKIKKGDNVIVIAGKDRGKTGKVLRTLPKTDRVLVEGINVGKRHQKSRKQGSRGQIIDLPMTIHVSNVSLKDKSGKAGRTGYTIEGEGSNAKKVRVIRPTGDIV